MAITLAPDPTASGGQVTNAQHESLWGFLSGGVRPGQAASAIAPAVSSARVWTVQPGEYIIRGHVMTIDVIQSGTLATNAGSPRSDLLVAFVDRTANPWTKGIAVRQGTSGAGRPAAVQSATGRWEEPLAELQVLNTGVSSMIADLRNVLVASSGLADTGWIDCSAGSVVAYTPAVTAQVRRQGPVCWMKGAVRKTASSPATRGLYQQIGAIIPAGFRPAANDLFRAVWTSYGCGLVNPWADGRVWVTASYDLGNNDWIDLGITWPLG